MNPLVKLYELKKGDKFYDPYEDLIYILIDCDVDMNDPDTIKWRAKAYKTDEIPETRQMRGMGVRDLEYYKYTGRDRNSFLAGFRSAVKICGKHMGSIEKENAGVNDSLAIHMTMLKAYKRWKENIGERL